VKIELDQNKLIILSAVIALGVYIGVRNMRGNASAQTNKVKNEIKRLEIEKEVLTLDEKLGSVSENFVKENQGKWLIEKLTQLTEENNIPVLSITPSSSPEQKLSNGGAIIKTNLKLSLKADYADLVKLITEIENSPEGIIIEEVSVSPDQPPLLQKTVTELVEQIGDKPKSDYRAEITKLEKTRLDNIKAEIYLTVSVVYFSWEN